MTDIAVELTAVLTVELPTDNLVAVAETFPIEIIDELTTELTVELPTLNSRENRPSLAEKSVLPISVRFPAILALPFAVTGVYPRPDVVFPVISADDITTAPLLPLNVVTPPAGIEIAALDTPVILPLESTVIIGTLVVLPYVAATTAVLLRVRAIVTFAEPSKLTLPVTSVLAEIVLAVFNAKAVFAIPENEVALIETFTVELPMYNE